MVKSINIILLRKNMTGVTKLIFKISGGW